MGFGTIYRCLGLMNKLFKCLSVLSPLLLSGVNAAKSSHYDLTCVGNCGVDAVRTETKPGVVMMGGGVSFCCYLMYLI